MDGNVMKLSVGAKGTVTFVMVVIDRWAATTVAAGSVMVTGITTVAVVETMVPLTVNGGGGTVTGTRIVPPMETVLRSTASGASERTATAMGGVGGAVVAGPATVTAAGEIASSTALSGSAEGTGT